MFYQKNTSHLNGKLIRQLNSLETIERLNVQNCKNGKDVTVAVEVDNKRKIYLHSYYDPQKEASSFISSFDLQNYEKIIVIGFAFGYHIEEILSKTEQKQQLIVVIINPDIFQKALELRDLSKVLTDHRLTLIFGQDENNIIESLHNFTSKQNKIKPKFIIHPASLNTIPAAYSKLQSIFETINTHSKSSEIYNNIFKSNIKNSIKYIINDTGVINFKNIFKNKPIFIISAGPSLNKNIEHLQKIGNKGIIIALGTSLNALITKGIMPDFIAVIHGEDNVYDKQMKKYLHLQIPILYIPGVNHNLLREYKGEKIVGLPRRDYYPQMELILHKGFIESAGSVSTVALDFAQILGGNPLIFVGQDLALSENGDKYSEETMEKENLNFPKNLQTVQGINGKKIYTLKNYHIFLRWIENYILTHPKLTFINSTEGGANIAGTTILPLQGTIKKYCSKNIDKTKINLILSTPSPQYTKNELEKIDSYLNIILKD